MNTFTDFKENFYKRVTDLTLFDCGEINLLKVVLDGLKVNYVKRGQVRSSLFYPLFLGSVLHGLKNKKSNTSATIKKKLELLKHKAVLISDMGRIVYDPANKPRSLYFDNIVKALGAENVIVLTDSINDKQQIHDLCRDEIERAFTYTPLNKEEKDLRKDILRTFRNIRKSDIFDPHELENIKYAFHKFFFEFKAWSGLLRSLPDIRSCYLVCHYHKEGQMYALKKNKIKSIELQHGLIAPQDIFYVLPKQVKQIKDKTLFADKILVYGQYWKDNLLKGSEYDSSQIDIVGYYLYDAQEGSKTQEEEINQIIGDKSMVLVTTQTYLDPYFIQFTNELSDLMSQQETGNIVLLKPHPAENKEIYLKAFEKNKNVVVVNYFLPLLLKKASWHVSAYSTTLYDALRYGLINYVFKPEPYNDYVNEIIASGIAEEVSDAADLLQKMSRKAFPKYAPEQFYESFHPTIITDLE